MVTTITEQIEATHTIVIKIQDEDECIETINMLAEQPYNSVPELLDVLKENGIEYEMISPPDIEACGAYLEPLEREEWVEDERIFR